ncbi:MAG: hypothetical protein WKF82_06470 [Nocardioidaceae bacterium]
MLSRIPAVLGASFAGNLGWGMILPFQYAYVVDSRGWGSLIGVLTGTAFCIGAVVAAPVAGRLTDRYSAARTRHRLLESGGASLFGAGLQRAPLTIPRRHGGIRRRGHGYSPGHAGAHLGICGARAAADGLCVPIHGHGSRYGGRVVRGGLVDRPRPACGHVARFRRGGRRLRGIRASSRRGDAMRALQ